MSSELLSRLSVLVLEDEYLIAMDVEHLCLEHGAAHVNIIKDLDALDAGDPLPPFDLAVLDLMLGDRSTLGFAADLQARGIPFVFATGYGDLDEHASQFPGVAVVAKPYSGIDLVSALANAWRARKVC
ncbi:MAG: response regulator [Rhizobiaceae bacterium]